MSEKEPHELVFDHREQGSPTWNCRSCGEIIQTSFSGLSLDTLQQKQVDHVCPKDLAKKRLRETVSRLEKYLDELGVRIEIYEDSYYSGSAELMLVDTKTGAELRLETGDLG